MNITRFKNELNKRKIKFEIIEVKLKLTRYRKYYQAKTGKAIKVNNEIVELQYIELNNNRTGTVVSNIGYEILLEGIVKKSKKLKVKKEKLRKFKENKITAKAFLKMQDDVSKLINATGEGKYDKATKILIRLKDNLDIIKIENFFKEVKKDKK